jgi:hypothetical protein
MLIVDSQVHIWESGTPVYHHRQVSAYTKDELLRDNGRRRRERSGAAPAKLGRAGERSSHRGRPPTPRPDGDPRIFRHQSPENRSLIDTWKNQPGMVGLRFAFLRPGEENWLTDGTADWLWPAAERAGLPIGLLAPSRQRLSAISPRSIRG